MTNILYEGHIPLSELKKNWALYESEIDPELRTFIKACVDAGIETLESCQGGWHTIRLYGRGIVEKDAAIIFRTEADPRVANLIHMAKLDIETFDVYSVHYGGIKVSWSSSETGVVLPLFMEWLQN